MEDSLISVRDLAVSFDDKPIIKGISFDILKNEVLAIVGESGSGKSVTSMAMMGLLPKNAQLEGSINFKGQNLLTQDENSWRSLRGVKISMIFQEPMTSLNPSMKCGAQVAEMLEEHTQLTRSEIDQKVLELFHQVKLPRAENMMKQYPHQLSGGQKQRVMIAMALACEPDLIIADEPTTALDVTVQQEILNLLLELKKEHGISIVFISHDLALVGDFADRVMVMYQGEIVERGTVQELFKHPEEKYTKALLKSRPSLSTRLKILPTVGDFVNGEFQGEVYSDQLRADFHKKLYNQAPLLEVKHLRTYFGKQVKAVDDVSFKLYPGETLGLVGESGCGKSTLGRSILGLEKLTSGQIIFKGIDLSKASKSQWKQLRKQIQLIFQDPFSSLNPRMTVGQAVEEPMKVHGLFPKNRKQKVIELLKEVGLDQTALNRYPHEFSGGQRQRIGIARSIAVNPELIICDESVSALDVSVQAQVLNLLNRLKQKHGFTYIFISHDLAVVKFMSDQLVVMNAGKIEESGDADQIYQSPQKSYTQKLIDAIPKGL